jgi:hypothetical protein
MWEDDIEAAWKAAHHGGCTRYLWLALAGRRASEKPADAIPVLQREILATVQTRSSERREESSLAKARYRARRHQAGRAHQPNNHCASTPPSTP